MENPDLFWVENLTSSSLYYNRIIDSILLWVCVHNSRLGCTCILAICTAVRRSKEVLLVIAGFTIDTSCTSTGTHFHLSEATQGNTLITLCRLAHLHFMADLVLDQIVFACCVNGLNVVDCRIIEKYLSLSQSVVIQVLCVC